MASTLLRSRIYRQLSIAHHVWLTLNCLIQILLLRRIEHSRVVHLGFVDDGSADTVAIPRLKRLRLNIHEGGSVLVACGQKRRSRRSQVERV